MSGRRFLGVLLSLLGAAVLLVAGLRAHDTLRFISSARSAPGMVIRLNAGGSHPQIGFKPESGVVMEYPQGGLIFGFRPGDPVEVLYDPDRPAATATVRSFEALWGESCLLAIIGGVLLVWGLSTLLMQSPPVGIFVRGR